MGATLKNCQEIYTVTGFGTFEDPNEAFAAYKAKHDAIRGTLGVIESPVLSRESDGAVWTHDHDVWDRGEWVVPATTATIQLPAGFLSES